MTRQILGRRFFDEKSNLWEHAESSDEAEVVSHVIPLSKCDWLNLSLLQVDDGEEKRNPVLDFPESLLVEDDQPVAMVMGGEDEEGAISDPGSEMMEESSEQVKVARNTAKMLCLS